MLHLKNNALARRKPLHGYGNARLNLFAEKAALGVQGRAVLPLALKEIADAFVVVAGVQFRGLVFGARLATAQMIEAHVGNDAVEPGVEAALEAETVKISVDFEESFLIDIAGVFGPLHQIQREPQDVA